MSHLFRREMELTLSVQKQYLYWDFPRARNLKQANLIIKEQEVVERWGEVR